MGRRGQFGHRRWIASAAMVGVVGVAAACGSGAGVRPQASRQLDMHVGSPGMSSVPVAAAQGALRPGEYYTSRFRPVFRFEVPEGWRLEVENPGMVYLSSGTFPDNSIDIYVLSPKQSDLALVDPPLADDGAPTGPRVEFPRDYLAFLSASPYLDATSPEQAELFGLHGSSVDALVTRTPAEGACNGAPGLCFVLFQYGLAAFTPQIEPRGAAMRVWSVERGDQQLIVIAAAVTPALTPARDSAVAGVLGTVQLL
jgi:hypothetical protein